MNFYGLEVKDLNIDIYDSDYETLKSYETYLRQLSPKSELRFYSTAVRLKEGVRAKPPDVIFAEADEIPPQSLMKDLREYALTTKVIFVSSSDYSAKDALNAGAFGYLTKPVTKEKLQQTMGQIEHPMLSKVKQILK